MNAVLSKVLMEYLNQMADAQQAPFKVIEGVLVENFMGMITRG